MSSARCHCSSSRRTTASPPCVITLVCAISGVVIGLILCLCQQQFGWLKLSGDPAHMIVSAYPVRVQWTDVLVTLGLVAAVGLLTSMVTALIMRRRLKS